MESTVSSSISPVQIKIFTAFVLLLYLVPTVHFLLFRVNQPSPDFLVYWTTGKYLVHGDINAIYQMEGPMVFRYSPFTLFLFAPLGFLSLEKARILWVLAQATCTLGSLTLLATLTRQIFGLTRDRTILTASIAALLIYRYYLANLRSGQVTPFSIILGCLGLFYWFRGYLKLGVMLLVARSFFKIVPALWLLPVVLILKKVSFRLILFGSVAAVSIGALLSTLIIDTSEFSTLPSQWLDLVFSHHEHYRSATTYSQSLPSVILRAIQSGYLPQGSYWLAVIGLSAAILLATISVWRSLDVRSTQLQFGVFASASMLVRLLAPDNFPYANLPLIFPIFYFLGRAWTSPHYRGLLLLIFVGLSYPGRDTVPSAFFEAYRAYSGPFAVRAAILIGFLLLLKKEAHADIERGSKPEAMDTRNLDLTVARA